MIFSKKNKISIKHEKFELNAYGYSDVGIYNIISSMLCSSDDISNVIEAVDTHVLEEAVTNLKVSDVNKDNDVTVDVNEVVQRCKIPTTYKNFRCPSCRQGFIIQVLSNLGNNNKFIFRNVSSENPIIKEINIENIIVKESDKSNKEFLINLYNSLTDIEFEQLVFVEDSENEAICPICGEKHYLSEWIESAYEPLKRFSTDMICPICGEDGKIIATGDTSYVECDDQCITKTNRR